MRERVACYVVRRHAAGWQLLVFDHVDFPESGTQVPAGGIDPGESIEDACRREVVEETGAEVDEVLVELGISRRPHPETGRPQRTTYVLATCAETRDEWTWLVTGNGDDRSLRFRCWFAPLPHDGLPLAAGQGEFLLALRKSLHKSLA